MTRLAGNVLVTGGAGYVGSHAGQRGWNRGDRRRAKMRIVQPCQTSYVVAISDRKVVYSVAVAGSVGKIAEPCSNRHPATRTGSTGGMRIVGGGVVVAKWLVSLRDKAIQPHSGALPAFASRDSGASSQP
jgi:hypothetical protein